MSSSNRAWIKGLVFIGLLISVLATIATGLGLEDAVERNGGNAGALLSSGEGSVGIHAALAGLIGFFLLLHLVVNRRSIIFTLKNMVKSK
ncbi:MAG TPA: hypothetical protein VGK23_05010 [Methanomassiliicoccales archaeon]